jgi:hypothetical protein
MDRRQLLLAGAFCTLADAAYAQQPTDSLPDTSPVKGQEELWYLQNAIETLIFLLTAGVLKEPEAVSRTRQDYLQYGWQMAPPNSFALFNDALQSPQGLARAMDSWKPIQAAVQKATTALPSALVSEQLRAILLKSFSRVSTLLAARSGDASWWCNCYGLRLTMC